jgi:hypothetical protein
VVLADKQLTLPPQKKSKKNTPAEADKEDHHVEEDNGNSLTAEPLQISDQEKRAKLEALQRARAEKTAHTVEAELTNFHSDRVQKIDGSVALRNREPEAYLLSMSKC